MESFLSYFEQLNTWQFGILALVVIALWFLPVVIALFFNPKHVKYIAIACVPAGFSVIAWSALLVWAFTGKVWKKYQDKYPETAPE